MNPETENFEELPRALVERLRARERAVPMVTPAVDRAVEAAARAQFAPRRRANPGVRHWRYAAAAAAAVALVALFIARPLDFTGVDRPRVADDVDGSGQVDILDAFALARTRAADPAAVSEGRIETLAARIVALSDTEAVL
jgi:anti-sigma-K factor RskA